MFRRLMGTNGLGSLRSAAVLFSVMLLASCGDPKAPILDDDPEAIRELKKAGAHILRLPIPGGSPDDIVVHVDLSDMSVDSEIIEHLNAVPFVRDLILSGSQITDETIAQLGDFKALAELSLAGSSITDVGLEHLSSKSMPQLYTLILDDTEITGAGLANMPPQISGISLVNVPIADEDLQSLEHMKRLRALTLTGTNVTAAGVRSLRQDRPMLLVMGIKMN